MNNEVLQFLSEFARGARLTFRNAERLSEDGILLRNNGSLGRAYFCHQISLEECGKLDILGTWATNLLAGGRVDLAKMMKSFRDHRSKNYENAYMAGLSADEKAARDNKDWDAARAAFERLQAEIHQFLNSAKNASIYVDFVEGRFVSPEDVVTDRAVDEISIVNRYFLKLSGSKVRLIERMQNEFQELRGFNTWFLERIAELNVLNSSEPEKAWDLLYGEMYERYSAISRKEISEK